MRLRPAAVRPFGRTAALLGAVVALVGLAASPASAAPSGTSELTPKQVQAQQWWITRLNLHKAWAISKGAHVEVAVLDTGVDGRFGDLRGALVPGFVAGGSGNGQTDTDPAYHGTLMADEIAGRGSGFGLLGVAPKATILPVTIPRVSVGTDATILALDRLAAMARPPAVVNMSYGDEGSCSPQLAQAVRRAIQRGMILVAGAGNSGGVANPADYPADCPGVVAVGAVDDNAKPWSDSERQSYVSLAAPGVHMIGYDTSASSGYGYADGTSDASAMVSGVFALLRAHFPNASARDLVTRVLYTARQFQGAPHTRNSSYGYGVALPYNALTRSVPANAPNPIYDAIGLTRAHPSGTTSVAPPTSAAGTSSGGDASTALTQTQAHSSGSSGTPVGLIVGLIAAAVVIVLLVVLLLRRRRPAQHGPPGPPGPWSPGP